MTHCASYRGIPRQCRARGQYRAVALTCIRPCPFCAHEPPVVAAVRSDGVKRDLGYVPAFAAIGPMAAALPICRAMWKWNRRLGGNGEASAAEGGYSLVVAVLFNEAAVKLDFLGFRNARSDDFAPLHLPRARAWGGGCAATSSGSWQHWRHQAPDLRSADVSGTSTDGLITWGRALQHHSRQGNHHRGASPECPPDRRQRARGMTSSGRSPADVRHDFYYGLFRICAYGASRQALLLRCREVPAM